MAKQVQNVAKASPGNLTVPTRTITKVTKPAPKAKLVKTRSDGMPRNSTTDIFGPNAPSRKLRLAQAGRLTAAELVTFLPHWLRSHDVLYRFVQNGADAHTLAKIINHNRRSTKSYGAVDNSLCKLMQKTMRERGYADWTISKHRAGLFKKDGEVWDKDNLSLTGGKVHCEDFSDLKRHGGPPMDNVEFASLANDIQAYPSEDTGDALDLTRCVKYAVANSHLPVQFPRDFVYLTNLTGGPQPVARANLDREVFERWNKVKKGTKPTHEQGVHDVEHYGFTVAQEVDVILYLSQFAVDGLAGQPDGPDILHEIEASEVDDGLNHDHYWTHSPGNVSVDPQSLGGSATFRDALPHSPAFETPVPSTGHSGGYMGQQQFGHSSPRYHEYNMPIQDESDRRTRSTGSRQESASSAARPFSTVPSSPGVTDFDSFDIGAPSMPIHSSSFNPSHDHGNLLRGLNESLVDMPDIPRGTFDYLGFGDFDL